MAQNEIDLIDVVALMAIGMVAGIVFGVIELAIQLSDGWTLTEAIATVAGTDITYALVIYLGSVGWILATNELDGSDYEPYEYGIILGTILAPAAYSFVPAVRAAVNASPYIQLVATLAVATAAVYISYAE